MTWRLLATALLAAAGLLAGGGVAWAHAGGLTSSSSAPAVLGVEPAVPGLAVDVVEYGARLRLVNDTGQRVTVVPLPGSVLSALPVVAPGGRALWSDPRVTSAAARDRPAEERLEWRIPMLVGGTAVTVVGEQRWPPPPNAGVWWLVTALALVVPTALVALGCGRAAGPARSTGSSAGGGPSPVVPPVWTRAALAATTTAVIGGHIVHIYGSALVPAQGAVIWLFLGAAGFAVVGWPIGLAGAVLTLRGSSVGPLLCLVAGAVLALIIAPVDVFSFHDAVVPYAWGADLDRALIALTVGGGLGVVAAATILIRRTSAPAGHEQR